MSVPIRITVPETEARRILLAQAIETVDTQGRLISDAEREALDVRAIDEARAAQSGHAGESPEARHIAPALGKRAERVLDAVAQRDPIVAGLGTTPSWRRQVIGGLPLLALLLGVLTDQIANPHRINLLSGPLFGLILWNLAVYLFLLVRSLRPPRNRPSSAGLRALVEWLLQPRGPLRGQRAEIRTRFLIAWHAVAARVNAHRATLILHLCAAAWAAGVAASLFVRGLVWEYRVGWEATFLTAEQLQALLAAVFWPVTALTTLEPFTLNQIVAMRFDAPDASNALANGRQWVYLYAALLAIVVVIPRLLLAAFAALRLGIAARRFAVPLTDPYFLQLLDRLVPLRVAMDVVTHRADDRAAIERMLRQHADRGGDVLVASTTGDALVIADPVLPAIAAASPAVSPWSGWTAKLLGVHDAEPPLPRLPDVVLHVVGDDADLATDAPTQGHDPGSDPESGAGAHATAVPPTLLLVRTADAGVSSALVEQCRLHRKHHASIVDVLAFDEFAQCWVQSPRLLEAIGTALPRTKALGFARLVAEWTARDRQRFANAMSVLAAATVAAARDVEPVQSDPVSLKTLISREHRAARTSAKTTAMQAVVERLSRVEAEALRELLRVHGLSGDETALAEQVTRGLEVKVDMQSAVDAPQAGLAGAASGAAMGASVDLVTGGLTLGVAALLGALVGGSAALLSAAWNNRKSPSGATTIQLSDPMLQAIVEAYLLRYLAVIHLAGAAGASPRDEPRPEWSSEVVAAVETQRATLASLWDTARGAEGAAAATSRLATELGNIARRVLRNLYPEAKLPSDERTRTEST